MEPSSLTVAGGIGALGALLAILTIVYGLFFYRLPTAGSAAVWNVPATLAPLALGMALLAASLALGTAAAGALVGGWLTITWWGLALVFLLLALTLVVAGARHGWAVPVASRSMRPGRAAAGQGAAVQGGLALTLVTVNLAIVLAWGAMQLTSDVPTAAAPVANASPTTALVQAATATVVATLAPSPTAATATAVPTPSPVLAALPTATPTALAALPPPVATPALVVRSAQGVNARRAPAVTAEIVGVLADGQELPVRGLSADGQWVQAVLEDGALAWVARSFVELTAPAEILPVVPSEP
jgi:hypothetical protein